MAEEIKQTQEKKDSKKLIVMALKYILGIALIILGGVLVVRWWGNLLVVIKGCLGLFLILSGIIALAIAKE